jgi:hypothetical protein
MCSLKKYQVRRPMISEWYPVHDIRRIYLVTGECHQSIIYPFLRNIICPGGFESFLCCSNNISKFSSLLSGDHRKKTKPNYPDFYFLRVAGHATPAPSVRRPLPSALWLVLACLRCLGPSAIASLFPKAQLRAPPATGPRGKSNQTKPPLA